MIENSVLPLDSLKKMKEEHEDIESSKPLSVSIMGQTGTGKSTLINALFDTNLKTDRVRPCTIEIEMIPIKGQGGHELHFYDLPGIGESQKADAKNIERYRQRLLESDIVLWTIHADNRSLQFDVDCLSQIMKTLDAREDQQAISKIVFVLTKVDLLTPPAWMLAKIDKVSAMFVPTDEIWSLLEAKGKYCREILLEPYCDLIVSKTYKDGDFEVSELGFSWDELMVYYNGLMNREELSQLTKKYPQYKEVFRRLHQHSQIVPCSALFRFNLNELLLLVINRLGIGAIHRFKHFYDDSKLNTIRYDEAVNLSNIFVYDAQLEKIVFRLSQFQF